MYRVNLSVASIGQKQRQLRHILRVGETLINSMMTMLFLTTDSTEMMPFWLVGFTSVFRMFKMVVIHITKQYLDVINLMTLKGILWLYTNSFEDATILNYVRIHLLFGLTRHYQRLWFNIELTIGYVKEINSSSFLALGCMFSKYPTTLRSSNTTQYTGVHWTLEHLPLYSWYVSKIVIHLKTQCTFGPPKH